MIGACEKLVEKALKRGLSEVEVYAVRNLARQFTVAKDRIVEAVYRDDLEVGVRGAIGKRVGFVRLNSLEVGVEEALDRLVAIAKSSPEDPYWSGFPADGKPLPPVKSFDEKTVSRSEEELVEVLEHTMSKLKEPALAKGVEAASVADGFFSVMSLEVAVANSNGLSKAARRSVVELWLILSVEKGGLQSDKAMTYSKNMLDERELEKLALEEGENALLFFGARPVESGVYDLVLTPLATGDILAYSLAPAFSALNVLENRSPIRDKLGKQVLSEEITLVDDPALEGATGTRPFDDEGVATKAKHVVDKGFIAGLLHNYYTARRMNTEPTGNGIRQRPHMLPLPNFTNMVLKPGSGSFEEFARDVSRGILVYEVIGHWMSDFVTGTAKATITHGLLVEGGRVVRPVKGVVIGGNVYEWLSSNLVGVGKDVVVYSNFAAPSIWIRGAKVAGQ